MESHKPRPDSDDVLMVRVQNNDTEAFARLYDRYASPAFSVAQSICHNRSDAEEAVQEGFLSVWRGRATYEPQPGCSFRGWAMQTVRNRAIDSHRRRRSAKYPRTGELDEEATEAVAPTNLDDLILREEKVDLSRLLDRLPDAQAEVITLAYFGEMSHTEITAQLGLPAGTVKGRMRLGHREAPAGDEDPLRLSEPPTRAALAAGCKKNTRHTGLG